jgi:hydroxymethylpyrimidine/phosphomethylpyrimidine kinase
MTCAKEFCFCTKGVLFLYDRSKQFSLMYLASVGVCRLESSNTHGTGCSLSSSIGALLAQGHPLADAVMLGKAYVRWETLCSAYSKVCIL